MREYINNIKRNDPAMRSASEIILYPSFWASGFHLAAHFLYKNKAFWLARFLSQLSRFLTGIEIHPGAKIGKCLFIDHGMGVVIGETAEIGDYVTIFHGVTLGGTGKEKGKRHPSIGNNVIIGCGAQIIGSFKVGDNSRIGAASVLLCEVPANSTVVGVPGRVVKIDGDKSHRKELDHGRLPDPVSVDIAELQKKVEALEKKL